MNGTHDPFAADGIPEDFCLLRGGRTFAVTDAANHRSAELTAYDGFIAGELVEQFFAQQTGIFRLKHRRQHPGTVIRMSREHIELGEQCKGEFPLIKVRTDI